MTYTQKDFDELIDEMWDKSGALMRSKGNEYANDTERLGNFQRIAAATGLTPEKVAHVLLMKHMDSIGQAVDKGTAFEWTTPEGGEGLKQRFADAGNYLLLLAANLEARDRDRCVATPAPTNSCTCLHLPHCEGIDQCMARKARGEVEPALHHDARFLYK